MQAECFNKLDKFVKNINPNFIVLIGQKETLTNDLKVCGDYDPDLHSNIDEFFMHLKGFDGFSKDLEKCLSVLNRAVPHYATTGEDLWSSPLGMHQLEVIDSSDTDTLTLLHECGYGVHAKLTNSSISLVAYDYGRRPSRRCHHGEGGY